MTPAVLEAGRITCEWTTEEALSEHLPYATEGTRCLALWGDGLVVVAGSAVEVRRLLERCLSVVPDEEGRG